MGRSGDDAPGAAESVEGLEHRARSRESALVREGPVRYHNDGVEVRRVESVRQQRSPGQVALKRREPQRAGSIARQEKPHQPIAQAADPVEKDDRV